MPIISDWHRAKTRKTFFRVIRSTVSLFPAPSFVSTRMNVRRRANDKRLPSSFFHRVSTEFFPRSINRIKRDDKKNFKFILRPFAYFAFIRRQTFFYSTFLLIPSIIDMSLVYLGNCARGHSREILNRESGGYDVFLFFFFLDTNDRRKCRRIPADNEIIA